MRKMFGWGSSSDMPSVYTHLTQEDLDSKLCEVYDVPTKDQKKKDETLSPKWCSNCSEKNDPTSKFCNKCGSVLTLEDALAHQETEKQVQKIENRAITEFMLNQEKLLKRIEQLEKQGGN